MAKEPVNLVLEQLKLLREDGKDTRVVIDGMQGHIQGLFGHVKEMRGDIKEMRGEIKEMHGDIAQLKGDVSQIKGDMRQVKVTQDRHTLSLDFLEERVEMLREGTLTAISVSTRTNGNSKKLAQQLSELAKRVDKLEKAK